MQQLEIDSRLVQGNKQIRQEARKFFCKLYNEEFSWTTKIDGVQFRELDETNRLALEREFTEDKIFVGLKHCTKDKAPYPNGFNMVSTQKFSEVMK